MILIVTGNDDDDDDDNVYGENMKCAVDDMMKKLVV